MSLSLSELKEKSPTELAEFARSLKLDNVTRMRKQDQIFAILKSQAKRGEKISGEGVVEILQDGFGFLRSSSSSYLAGPDDVYVSPSQIRRFGLRTGDTVTGLVRPPKDSERYFALLKVETINSQTPDEAKKKILFENLTPLHPDERIRLEQGNGSSEDLTGRTIDIVSPIGKGQRGLLVSAPKTGKTVMLQQIAHAITASEPECELIVLLIDERPEEVTEMKRTVRGEVVSSTFDEPASRHVQVAEMVIEKAKRLVEHKKDVVILLDSITRLARAYNTVQPASGKVLTGGVDANALQKPKRFFWCRSQHRRRWQPDHFGHGPNRYRLQDGRGDLRGVQGHRQHGDSSGSPHRREAGLSIDCDQPLRHPPRRAAHGSVGTAEDLAAQKTVAPDGRY